MTRALDIHVNRTDHHDVETRTKRFAPDGPFEVHVQNHGEGLHVHVAVTGEFAFESAQFDGNPFVESDSTLELPVRPTTDDRPASGTVEVTAGYGQNGVSVDVDLVDDSADASGDRSTVDRSAGSSDGRASGRVPSSASTGSGASRSNPSASSSSGATAAFGGIASLPAALATRGSEVVARFTALVPSSRGTDTAEGSEADAPAASFDAGSVLLAALASLAICAAAAALALFSGPAVAIGVVAVFLTVIGVGLYLVV